MSIKRTLKIIIIRSLPLVILGLVVWRADIRSIGQLLSGAKAELVGFGYLLLEVGVFLRAIRWKILATEQNIVYQFGRSWTLFRIGWFTGIFLPQGWGAMTKIVYMKADGHASAPSAATIVLERALDLVSLIVYGITGVCYLVLAGLVQTNLSPNYKSIIVVACSIILVLLITLHFRKSRMAVKIRERIKEVSQKQKIVQWFVKLGHAITKIPKSHLLGLTFMTLIIWTIHALSAYLLLKAIQVEISFLISMAIFAVAGVSVAIPISIDGVGLREGATFLLFRQLGLGVGAAVTWAAMISATSLLSRLIGAPLLVAMPLPWKKAMKRDDPKPHINQ